VQLKIEALVVALQHRAVRFIGAYLVSSTGKGMVETAAIPLTY